MQNLRHTDLPDVRQFEIESKLIQVVEQHLGGEVLALNKPLWVFISDDLKTYRILKKTQARRTSEVLRSEGFCFKMLKENGEWSIRENYGY